MIDLHTHSTASDGSYTPSELARHAAAAGISVFSLTDHDSVSGLEESYRSSKEAGIGFIPGVELDVEWRPGECHLLGYGVSSSSLSLKSLLIELNEDRKKRNTEIIARMNESGIAISMAEVEESANGGTIGRPHFARLLVERKVVRSIQHAFDRYLGKDRPFFIERKSIPMEAGIAAITASGGIPILAHPLSLYVSFGRLAEVIARFKDLGVRGLEAWHPAARIIECERLESLAKSLGMLVTSGSDFHGSSRPDRKIGKTAGKRPILDQYLPSEFQDYIMR